VSAPGADLWTTLPLGEGVAVLHHDADGIGALNKPAGILSHPNRRGEEPRSLLQVPYDEEAQAYRWTADGAERRLWLLNRLDGATSGVLLVAADPALAAAIREQFARKRVRKVYNALVFGAPRERVQLWRDLLAVQKRGGQVRTSAMAGNIPAVTQFSLLTQTRGAFSTSLVRLEPQTGRSHQLRVQAAKRGLPIVGDQTYGDFGLNRSFARATGESRLFLHSLETSFTYEWNGRPHTFKAAAPLPPEFRRTY
jgi:23S rRNA pseudouridine955/2504/2580 synthase